MKADNLVSFLILGESFQTFTIEYNVGYGFAIYVLMKFPYIASFLRIIINHLIYSILEQNLLSKGNIQNLYSSSPLLCTIIFIQIIYLCMYVLQLHFIVVTLLVVFQYRMNELQIKILNESFRLK